MSRYSYAGDFVNPVGSWRVASRKTPEGDDEFFIEVFRSEERELDGVTGTFQWWAPHTAGHAWSQQEDAVEWMETTEQAYEDDYDDWLEENGPEIARMERYEQWRNEY